MYVKEQWGPSVNSSATTPRLAAIAPITSGVASASPFAELDAKAAWLGWGDSKEAVPSHEGL